MTSPAMLQDYAIAIRPLGTDHAAPVVYDLMGPATDIGAAEDNNIVLTGPGVEPYHLAIRQVDERLVLVVDWSLARREGLTWKEPRPGDRLYCPLHGTLPPELGRCPRCASKNAALWLIRLVEIGDAFPIGQGFEATVLNQVHPKSGPGESRRVLTSPWPEILRMVEVQRSSVQIRIQEPGIADKPYPLDNSNLWMWSPAEAPLPVFMHHHANHYVTRHAYRNADREIGGLLIGSVFRDPGDDLHYPVITHAIPARYAAEERGHLTFTHDTWRDLNRQREEHYPDKQVVGWYHTHPGLDIFLSQMDLFVHRNFFRQPWQVALVIDPHQDAGGFFVWSGGDLLDPQTPHQLFRIADLKDQPGDTRSRIRIKLGERAE